MYNLPELRAANAALWTAIRDGAAGEGVTDLPENLDFDRPAVPGAIEHSMVFSQVCGYPLQTIFHGKRFCWVLPVTPL